MTPIERKSKTKTKKKKVVKLAAMSATSHRKLKAYAKTSGMQMYQAINKIIREYINERR